MRALLAVSLVLALATGCGGDDGDARKEFVDQANANCAERQRAERELRERPAGESLDDPDAWKRLFDRELEQQRRLDPPEELAADWRRYQALSRESIAAYRAIDRAARADFDRRSVLQGKALRAAAQSRVVARKLGLDVCAKQIY